MSTEERPVRTFGFGGDAGAPVAAFVAQYENRYGDVRVVIDSPAPWNTPDGIRGANDIIKALEWDDHHWTFEEECRRGHPSARGSYEDVWVVDESAVEPLTAAFEDAGYEVEDDRGATDSGVRGGPSEELIEACEYTEEGDEVVVTYESKQTGSSKTKTGSVTAVNADPSGGRTVGISLRRDDGNSNTVKADDSGRTGVFCSSQYPFMGTAESLEVRPGEGDDEGWEWE